MKIIFLDFDGVLNYQKFVLDRNRKIRNIEPYDSLELLDLRKVLLVKDICNNTGAKIVVVSSWKKMLSYSDVEKVLKDIGLPIIGTTITNEHGTRGKEIKDFIKENNIKNYIVIDDEIFNDYDEEILSRLIKTSFYEDGITYENVKEAILKLK